jgi:hypothetical protein
MVDKQESNRMFEKLKSAGILNANLTLEELQSKLKQTIKEEKMNKISSKGDGHEGELFGWICSRYHCIIDEPYEEE